jgi:hypothetical protein
MLCNDVKFQFYFRKIVTIPLKGEFTGWSTVSIEDSRQSGEGNDNSARYPLKFRNDMFLSSIGIESYADTIFITYSLHWVIL